MDLNVFNSDYTYDYICMKKIQPIIRVSSSSSPSSSSRHSQKGKGRTNSCLSVTSYKIHIEMISGHFFQFTSFFEFFNNQQKDKDILEEEGKGLEGEVNFYIPKNSKLSGFGVDCGDGEGNDMIIDAIPVPKLEEKRVVFSEKKEKKNNGKTKKKKKKDKSVFKIKLYPMKRQQKRYVKIIVIGQMTKTTLLDDTDTDNDNEKYDGSYYWPLEIDKSVQTFQIDFWKNNENMVIDDELMIKKYLKVKDKEIDITKYDNLDLNKIEKILKKNINGMSYNDIEGVIMKSNVELLLQKKKKSFVFMEKVNNENNAYYFYTKVLLPNNKLTSLLNKKTIKEISVYWDCSNSRIINCDLVKEIETLFYIIESYDYDIKVNIIPFSEKEHERKKFYSNHFRQIKEFLTKIIVYDGATCFPKSIVDEKVDFCLLYFDGIVTYGDYISMKMKFNSVVFSITSSHHVCNKDLLNFISHKSGGCLKELKKDKEDIDYEQFTTTTGQIDCSYNEKEISDVFTVVNDRFLNIYGKVYKKKANLSLNIGNSSSTIQINQKECIISSKDLLRVLWAQQKISRLSVFSKNPEIKKKIRDFGRKHRIPTGRTSLMVLNKIEDYLKYGVCPDESVGEVIKEYQKIISERNKDEERQKKEKLQKVINLWEERKKWHQTDFNMESNKTEIEGLKSKQFKINRNDNNNESGSEDYEDDFDTKDVGGLRDGDECDKFDVFDSDEENEIEKRVVEEKKRYSIVKERGFEKRKPHHAHGRTLSEIVLQSFEPDVDYIDKIRDSDNSYAEYLNLKKNYIDSPSYYFDCADFFLNKGKKEIGIRILSNIAELNFENIQLFRVYGYRLEQENELKEAKYIFERILHLRKNEPQSYRDLALVLEKLEEFERAIELMNDVIVKKWDDKFHEIELTACLELNHMANRITRKKILNKINKKLIYKMDCDIRIVLKWDTNNDIDLHISDSNSEHCYYGNRITTNGILFYYNKLINIYKIGGYLSRDFNEGLGPIEFLQKRVRKSGDFVIAVKHYSDRKLTLVGATTILCTIYTHYLRENELVRSKSVRLSEDTDNIEIGKIFYQV